MSNETTVKIVNAEDAYPLEAAPLDGSAVTYAGKTFIAPIAPSLHVDAGENGAKLPLNLGHLVKEPSRILTEAERKSQKNPRDPQETAMLAKQKRPLDAYEDKVDKMRRSAKLLTLSETPQKALSDATKLSAEQQNQYAAYVLNALANHTNHWYDYISRFVNDMYGASQRAFWKRMEDGWTRLLNEEKATENRLAWNAFFSIAGARPEKGDESNVHGDCTLHINQAMNKLMTQYNNIGQPYMETNSCTPYDLTQCIRQKIELCRMMQGYCKGYGTSEIEQEVIRYALEQMGRNMTDDLCLVDKTTNQPDMNRVVFQVPHYANVDMLLDQREEKLHYAYDSAEANSAIESAPGSCRTIKSKQIGSYAVSAGYWTGKLHHTVEAATGAGAEASTSMSWGMGHCANVALKMSLGEGGGGGFYKAPYLRTEQGQVVTDRYQSPNAVHVTPTAAGSVAPKATKMTANAMDQMFQGSGTFRGQVHTVTSKSHTPHSRDTAVRVGAVERPPARVSNANASSLPRMPPSLASAVLELEKTPQMWPLSALLFDIRRSVHYKSKQLPSTQKVEELKFMDDSYLMQPLATMAMTSRQSVTSPTAQKEIADRKRVYRTLYRDKNTLFSLVTPSMENDAIFNPVKMFLSTDPHVMVWNMVKATISFNPWTKSFGEWLTKQQQQDLHAAYKTAFKYVFPKAQMSSKMMHEEATALMCHTLESKLRKLGKNPSYVEDTLVLNEMSEHCYYDIWSDLSAINFEEQQAREEIKEFHTHVGFGTPKRSTDHDYFSKDLVDFMLKFSRESLEDLFGLDRAIKMSRRTGTTLAAQYHGILDATFYYVKPFLETQEGFEQMKRFVDDLHDEINRYQPFDEGTARHMIERPRVLLLERNEYFEPFLDNVKQVLVERFLPAVLDRMRNEYSADDDDPSKQMHRFQRFQGEQAFKGDDMYASYREKLDKIRKEMAASTKEQFESLKVGNVTRTTMSIKDKIKQLQQSQEHHSGDTRGEPSSSAAADFTQPPPTPSPATAIRPEEPRMPGLLVPNRINPNFTADEAKEFLSLVARSTFDPKRPRDTGQQQDVYKYLTGQYTESDHLSMFGEELGDKGVGNVSVFWANTMEGTGARPFHSYFYGETDIRFANNNGPNFRKHRDLALDMFHYAYNWLQKEKASSATATPTAAVPATATATPTAALQTAIRQGSDASSVSPASPNSDFMKRFIPSLESQGYNTRDPLDWSDDEDAASIPARKSVSFAPGPALADSLSTPSNPQPSEKWEEGQWEETVLRPGVVEVEGILFPKIFVHYNANLRSSGSIEPFHEYEIRYFDTDWNVLPDPIYQKYTFRDGENEKTVYIVRVGFFIKSRSTPRNDSSRVKCYRGKLYTLHNEEGLKSSGKVEQLVFSRPSCESEHILGVLGGVRDMGAGTRLAVTGFFSQHKIGIDGRGYLVLKTRDQNGENVYTFAGTNMRAQQSSTASTIVDKLEVYEIDPKASSALRPYLKQGTLQVEVEITVLETNDFYYIVVTCGQGLKDFFKEFQDRFVNCQAGQLQDYEGITRVRLKNADEKIRKIVAKIGDMLVYTHYRDISKNKVQWSNPDKNNPKPHFAFFFNKNSDRDLSDYAFRCLQEAGYHVTPIDYKFLDDNSTQRSYWKALFNPRFGNTSRYGIDKHEGNPFEHWHCVMRMMGYFGVVFDNHQPLSRDGDPTKHDPFKIVGEQIPAFRCFIPSYENMHRAPMLAHVRNDLQELKRFYDSLGERLRAAIESVIENSEPEARTKRPSRVTAPKDFRDILNEVQHHARVHCKKTESVYARAWGVKTAEPPLTFTSKFMHILMNPDVTRDTAMRLFDDNFVFPELSTSNSVNERVDFWSVYYPFKIFCRHADSVARAFARFDPCLYFIDQFETTPVPADAVTALNRIKRPRDTQCARPMSLTALASKTFGVCDLCGVFPYRLLSTPYISLAKRDSVDTDAELEKNLKTNLLDFDQKNYSQLRSESSVFNALQETTKAPDLNKLFSLRNMEPAGKLITLRGILSACYGPDVAAMICECTLLRDPVMMNIAVATGEDVPFVNGRTMIYHGNHAGMSPHASKLGDTDLTVVIENNRVYLREGSVMLTEDEAAYRVMMEILRAVRDNVITVTDAKSSTEDKRLRLAEQYLMLNADAILATMRSLKAKLNEWDGKPDKSNPRVMSLDTPELFLVVRASMEESDRAKSALMDTIDLALPYAFTFEEFSQARSPATNPKLFDIVTKVSLLPDFVAKHIPFTMTTEDADGISRTGKVPTWNPSVMPHSAAWTDLVREFSDYCTHMVDRLGCAQTPVTFLSNMDLLSEERSRGVQFDEEKEPTFGMAPDGRCERKEDDVNIDVKLFNDIKPTEDDAYFPSARDKGPVRENCGAIESFDICYFPVGERVANFSDGEIKTCTFNSQERQQFFSVIDACGQLWARRAFHNPAHARAVLSDGEPERRSSKGTLENMHYYARKWAEASVVARRAHDERCGNDTAQAYEVNVKKHPDLYWPVSIMGQMVDESFRALYPLQPLRGSLRKKIERVNSLPLMYAVLNTYGCKNTDEKAASVPENAWCPVSHHHYYQLLRAANLFDNERQIPINPWTSMGPKPWSFTGFMHSHHSCLHVDSLQPEQYADYCTNYLQYQTPRDYGETPHVPYSRYGGTPVAADFIGAPVHKPAVGHEQRNEYLRQSRFGQTYPLDIGQLPFEEHGILQDAYSYEYRQSLKLSPLQVEAVRNQTTDCVHISNFGAYTRLLTLLALASRSTSDRSDYGDCDRGLVVRNLMRLYTGVSKYISADGIEPPVIFGYAPVARSHRSDPNSDRPILAYACSVSTLKKMMELITLGAVPRSIPGFDSSMRQVLISSVNDVATLIYRESDNERFLKSLERGYRHMRQLHPTLTEMEYMKKMMQSYRLERNQLATQVIGDLLAQTNSADRRDAIQALREILVRDVANNHLDHQGDLDRAAHPSADGTDWTQGPYGALHSTLFTTGTGQADADHAANMVLKQRDGATASQKLKRVMSDLKGNATMRHQMVGSDPLRAVGYSVPTDTTGLHYAGAASPSPSFSPAPSLSPALQSDASFRGDDTQVSSTLGKSQQEIDETVEKIRRTVESRYAGQRRFQGTGSSFMSRSEILDSMNVPDFLARTVRRQFEEY